MRIVIFALVFISLVGLGYALFYSNKTTPAPVAVVPSLTPTHISAADEFSEITIPSLRARSYKSSLGEIREISKNGSYSRSLTSYDSDGFKINGLLTQSLSDRPANGWPAIVFVHGYIPPTLYKTEEKYVEYVDNLAKNGFVVFKIDLRGHGDSEGEARGGYYSSDYIVDTLNAVAALKSSGFVNPQKIGLWGHSMAGNVVLRSLMAQPSIPVGVVWAGAGYTYTDLREYGLNDTSYRPPGTGSLPMSYRQQLFAKHGQFDPENDFWKQVAPTNYLSDYMGAIQLHHAQDDTVVDIKYSQNLNKLLSSTQIPHEFYEYDRGGHNISNPSFGTAMSRTVAYFKKYLE